MLRTEDSLYLEGTTMDTTSLLPDVPRPRAGVLFGVTHNLDGTLRRQQPKYLKVGIGLPKGPALYVWKRDDKWVVQLGYNKDNRQIKPMANRDEAEKFYRDNIGAAPVCPFPQKISFF